MKKLWEVNDYYFCLISGYCLTPTEQTALLRKYLGNQSKKMDAIEIHHCLMENFSTENKMSRAVEIQLNKKYLEMIQSFKDYSIEQWINTADEFLTPLHFDAFIWISATHKTGNFAQEEKIRNLIHTYTHQIYFDLQAEKKQSTIYEKENKTLNFKYKEIKKELKEGRKKSNELSLENSQLNITTKAQKKIILGLQEECKIQSKKTQSDASYNHSDKTKIKQLKEQIQNLQNENNFLENKLDNQAEKIGSMHQELRSILGLLEKQEAACKDCEKVDLCNKRILIVGGISKLRSYYREIVQRLGGSFTYHEGYCKSGSSTLEERIQQSDIIVCPVDVNSHAACLQVKKTCKRIDKKYLMLRSSSISSLYTGLIKLSEISEKKQNMLPSKKQYQNKGGF